MKKKLYEGDTSLCKPGLFCLQCPYPDCVIAVVRVKPEETKLLEAAGLADGRRRNKRKRKEG